MANDLEKLGSRFPKGKLRKLTSRDMPGLSLGFTPFAPSASEKQALAGSAGSPSISNRYVTEADARLIAIGEQIETPAGWLSNNLIILSFEKDEVEGYSVQLTDYVIEIDTSGYVEETDDFALSLHPSVDQRKLLFVKNRGPNPFTIYPSATSDLIDGSSSLVLNNKDWVVLVADGESDWNILQRSEIATMSVGVPTGDPGTTPHIRVQQTSPPAIFFWDGTDWTQIQTIGNQPDVPEEL